MTPPAGESASRLLAQRIARTYESYSEFLFVDFDRAAYVERMDASSVGYDMFWLSSFWER